MQNIDLSELDLQKLGSMPAPVRAGVIVAVCVAVLVLGYFLHIQNLRESLARAEAQELTLKRQFEEKQARAASLDDYKQQMKEMEETFGAMLRQLPSKTEVEALLVDISQTGLSSGTTELLFRPQQEKHIEFYAELPIEIKLAGTYHQFGNFVSGIAALPRIVTLHDISIKRGTGGNLEMDVLAKTYRYLDENELAAIRQPQQQQRRR